MIQTMTNGKTTSIANMPKLAQDLVSDDTLRLIDIMGLLDEKEQEIVLATAMTLVRVKSNTMTQ